MSSHEKFNFHTLEEIQKIDVLGVDIRLKKICLPLDIRCGWGARWRRTLWRFCLWRAAIPTPTALPATW